LWPLSQGELEARRETFLERLLSGDLPTTKSPLGKRDYLERAVAGGFPEAVFRRGARRRAWFTAYVTTVIEREAPGISASPRTADLPRLLRLVAARHGGVINVPARPPRRPVHRRCAAARRTAGRRARRSHRQCSPCGAVALSLVEDVATNGTVVR